MAKPGRKPARAATRNDVARLSGVNSAVLSYVVNDGPRPVAPATRARVLEAIAKLGYRPNAASRSLITGRSHLLGLIVPDLENPYFAGLAKAVETAAAESEMRLVLAQCASEGLADMVESLAGHQVDGIITATLPPPSLLAHTAWGRVPMVKLSLAMPLEVVPALSPDFYGGSLNAVRHLVETHLHRRIALVTGSEQSEVRERAWNDALTRSGLTPGPVVRVPWSAEGGWAAADRLVRDAPEATAVFVTWDQTANGLLAGLHRLGLRVPHDMAVASFDGAPSSAFTIPPLTTVAVAAAEMARDAVDELLGAPAVNRTYPTTLIVRRSCGCEGVDEPAADADYSRVPSTATTS